VTRLAGNACAIRLIRMPTAATEVSDIPAGTQPFRTGVCDRQYDVDQRGVEHLAALLGHQLVEPRILATPT
jgi:hypothetical protein